MSILIAFALTGQCHCPKPPQAPTRRGKVEVVHAIEVYSPPVKPGPVAQAAKAAVNVVTAPAKIMQQVCNGGQCRMVEVDAPPAAPATGGECQSCSGGQCYQPQRRGWFGRRRGW